MEITLSVDEKTQEVKAKFDEAFLELPVIDQSLILIAMEQFLRELCHEAVYHYQFTKTTGLD